MLSPSMNIVLNVVTCLLSLMLTCSLATNVTYDANAIIIDGERRILFSGSIHYPRSTVDMWPDLIKKSKDGGIDVIETYIFWDSHEPHRRQYDFSGNLDFIKFFKMVQQAGLYVFMRIGPYVCAEWNYGGFPAWLHNMPGIQLRTDNQVYKDEMQLFVSKIVGMCKEANLFAPQGGPIILAQIENEYGDVMGSYGDAGKKYVQWCAKMADSMDIGVPWVMCKQEDAPQPMINTCNGYYCDQFTPNNPNSPKMWTENWSGWYKKWGGRDPHRTPEDLAFSVARFFQTGGVLMNYYMYHGGTNFGRTSGGPFIVTSYDYNAPLDEYGNLNQPKWGHLKELHEAIKVGEKILTAGQATSKDMGNGVTLTTYSNNAAGQGHRFCFLSNTDTSKDADVDLQKDGKYHVPAWSVSILDGCNKEIYNTAKVNKQSSAALIQKDLQQRGAMLSWKWTPEEINDTLDGSGGKLKAEQLLEQLKVTEDASDFLWYMTTTEINDTIASMNDVTLRVNITGAMLQVYVNKEQIGVQWGQSGGKFVFEKPVKLKPGKNYITILSATVGLANYGAFYDLIPYGIVGGPVQLRNNKNVVIDLSTSQWSYKIGLNGENQKLYVPDSPRGKNIWRSGDQIPKNTSMIWYSTTFESPAGNDPVVLNLQGMGKGEAWVNGRSIGRFWPSHITVTNGCSDSCDYRGEYKDTKCNTNCGKPTQIWYHVPRSFLNKIGSNTLIMFEQLGGDPSNISIHTITQETMCESAIKINGNIPTAC